MTYGVDLGEFLIGFAILDVVAVLLMVRAVRRNRPNPTPEQDRTLRVVLAAALVMGAGLCLIALLVPSIARIPVF